MIFRKGDKVRFVTEGLGTLEGIVADINESSGKLYVSAWDELNQINRYLCVSEDDAIIIPGENHLLTDDGKHHDEHYALMAVQPIEIIQACLTPAEFKGWLRGQIIKYMVRAGHKKGESFQKDVDKADRFREWLLQAEVGLTVNPRE